MKLPASAIPNIDRRIAATLLYLCLLGSALVFAILGQFDLAAMRAEGEAKTALLTRLSRANLASAASDTRQPMSNPFVTAETATTAAAEIDRLIRAIAAKAGGTVLSTQATSETSNAPVRRIDVQAVIEGNLEIIQRVLFNLEAGSPMIFIDDLTLIKAERRSGRTDVAQSPHLQANVAMNAFWRSKQ